MKPKTFNSLQDIYKYHASRDWIAASDKGTTHTYINIYNELFMPYRDKFINILEIGVASGHSLLMWEEFFTQANIYGIDITSMPKILNKRPRIHYYQGDSTTVSLINAFNDVSFNIIIDDGCHELPAQILTASLFINKIKRGGLYIVEDVHSDEYKNYFKVFGTIKMYGSFKKDDRMIVIKPK